MAQMPTIASTAGRRILPSADLRVDGVSPAAFGAAVGAGLQQLGDAGADAGKAVQQFELVKQEEANRLAEFDRQTTFVAFGSDQATKLEEAKRGLSGPAQDFTKTTMAAFDADAAAFLEKVPERDRHAWQARMGQLRAGFAGDALRAEFGQRDSYYKTTIADSLGKLQNGAMQQPDKLADWLAQGDAIIGASGLSAQDKLEYSTRWKGAVSVAAAQGDVMRDPEGAITRLGGVDHVTALEAAGKIGGGANVPVPGGTAAYVDPLRGRGGSPIQGGGYGAKRDYGAHQGTDFTGARGTPVQSGAGAGTVRVSHSEKGGNIVTIDHGGGVVTRYMHLDRVDVKDGQRVTGDTVLGSVGATGRASGPHLHYEVIVGGKHVDPTGLAGKPMPAQARAAAPGVPAAPAATAVAPQNGQTELPPVDPRYAELPFEARAQLIGSAQQEIDRRQQVEYAAEQEAHNDWLNGFMTDLLDGKAGRADIEAARSAGHLTDYSEIAQATNIVEQREQKTAALSLYNAMLSGGGQFNPYDDNAKNAVNAAFTAQAQVQGSNPLQVAMNIWQRTGVLPDAGATMLRGGLVSTDANQVAMAASVASNMLQRNPNAFAGVQGGNDIEQAAALYSHYVNDLGLTAQDAAQRVAQRNAPDVRRRVDVNKPAIDAFRTKLRKTDVGNLLSNAFGGWLSIDPEFTAPEQVNAAAQDYADFAAEHYEQHGDEGAAQAYAMAQMQKLYGSVNGRLMKFPPTRAYPAVQGSHDYIFEQAAGDIQRVTGRKIAPDKIYLMPIPTATAQAFRAGRPTPYSVHYIDTVGGQEVYRTLPGVAFTADVAAVQRAAYPAFARARDRELLKQSEARTVTLRDIQDANPRNAGEGVWAYSQRMGRLLAEAQTALHEDQARVRRENPTSRRDRQKKDESTRAILRSRNQFGTYN